MTSVPPPPLQPESSKMASAPSSSSASSPEIPCEKSKSTKKGKTNRSFWGKHRRRHTRNETLTIVWNYAAATFRAWLGKPPQPYDASYRTRLLQILPWTMGENNGNSDDHGDGSKNDNHGGAQGARTNERSSTGQKALEGTDPNNNMPKDVSTLNP